MNLQNKIKVYLLNQKAINIKLHNLELFVKGKRFFEIQCALEEIHNKSTDWGNNIKL
ncbi:MAG: hypothetical protein ACRC41_02295 [Sarcina sp.]